MKRCLPSYHVRELKVKRCWATTTHLLQWLESKTQTIDIDFLLMSLGEWPIEWPVVSFLLLMGVVLGLTFSVALCFDKKKEVVKTFFKEVYLISLPDYHTYFWDNCCFSWLLLFILISKILFFLPHESGDFLWSEWRFLFFRRRRVEKW